VPGELVEYVLKLVEYLLKLLKLLPAPPKVAGAATLLPPLIGVAQLGWRYVKETSSEQRKKALREKIVGLQQFLQAIPETDLSEEQTRAYQDARRERSLALSRLAGFAPVVAQGPAALPAPVQQRSWIRRAFLLYAPSPPAVWILHGLFYFCLTELAAMLIALAAELAAHRAGEAVAILPAAAMFGVPLLVFWGLAADSDRSVARSRNTLQRWLLLYRPERRGRWVWHVLFYIALVALISLTSVMTDLVQSRSYLEALWAPAFWLLLVLGIRKAAVRRPQPAHGRSRVERWLLLYAPRRRWAWLLHFVFWAGVLATAGILIFLFSEGRGEEPITLQRAWEFCIGLIFMAICWNLATDLEQRTEGPPGALRRALLLFAPDRGALWIWHVLFYFSVLEVGEGVVELATGEMSGQLVSATGEVLLTNPAGLLAAPVYFLLLAAVSRALALRREPWGAGMAGWIQWLGPGRLPRRWFQRLGYLVGAAVFYAAAFLFPLLALNAVDSLRTHDAAYLWKLLLPVAAAGMAGRWTAHRLQAEAGSPPQLETAGFD